jgi:hypothetical protein
MLFSTQLETQKVGIPTSIHTKDRFERTWKTARRDFRYDMTSSIDPELQARSKLHLVTAARNGWF